MENPLASPAAIPARLPVADPSRHIIPTPTIVDATHSQSRG
jgi:hypothetical protein